MAHKLPCPLTLPTKIKDSQRSVEPKKMKIEIRQIASSHCCFWHTSLNSLQLQNSMTRNSHTTSKSDFDMTWMEYKIRGVIRVWTTTTFIQHQSGVLSYYFYIKSTVWQWWRQSKVGVQCGQRWPPYIRGCIDAWLQGRDKQTLIGSEESSAQRRS